jgi:hypothetical protein
LCQERARVLQQEREAQEEARQEEMEREREREARRDDQRLMAAAIRGPPIHAPFMPLEVVDMRCHESLDASFSSTTSTASTLILRNENFVNDEVSLLKPNTIILNFTLKLISALVS